MNCIHFFSTINPIGSDRECEIRKLITRTIVTNSISGEEERMEKVNFDGVN